MKKTHKLLGKLEDSLSRFFLTNLVSWYSSGRFYSFFLEFGFDGRKFVRWLEEFQYWLLEKKFLAFALYCAIHLGRGFWQQKRISRGIRKCRSLIVTTESITCHPVANFFLFHTNVTPNLWLISVDLYPMMSSSFREILGPSIIITCLTIFNRPWKMFYLYFR